MKGFKLLGQLIIKYLPLLLIVLILAFIDPSHTPLFIKYVFMVLNGETPIDVRLPIFLVSSSILSDQPANITYGWGSAFPLSIFA